MGSYLLALALIGCDALPIPPYPTEADCTALRQVALNLELADPRENWLFHSTPGVFLSDPALIHKAYHRELTILRHRRQLLSCCPPSHDCHRWGLASELSASYLAFAREHLDNLKAAHHAGMMDDGEERIRECERLIAVWMIVQDVGAGYNLVHYRRVYLYRLREEIGADAYYAGTLPPPVPTWRFRWIGN